MTAAAGSAYGRADRGAYLPIADHGVIGDLRSAALVGLDGTIDWFCPLRFDGPSVFASILDAERGGHYRIAPREAYTTKQLYFPDTNVLITRFLSAEGVGEVQDFMTIGGEQRLVRRVVCIRGTIDFRLECEPRFDYGRATHETSLSAGGAHFRSPDLSLALGAPVPLTRTLRGVTSDFRLAAGETASFTLSVSDLAPEGAPSEAEAEALFDATVAYWVDWIAQSNYTGRWREMVNRSALALKLLTYEPTGAIVAAATTSLPEQIGGGRNWDYRYSWVRDSAFTLYALLRLGFAREAKAFGGFLRSCFEAMRPNGNGPLQLMYGIDGRTDLPEETLDHFSGYEGSAPVRIGNGAAGQLQLDIYGEIIDAAYIAETFGHGRMSYDAWQALSSIVDWLCENWNRPDEGIWETRGGQQHFTHSRLMSWVALDRAIRIANGRAFPADLPRWIRVRDEIYRTIMERNWSEKRQAFVQYEGTDVLDASVLLMPLVHFIAPDDPRWLSTLDAIGADLVSDSLVYRYDPEVSSDGLDGGEGTFSICSFWYVEALSRAGRVREARIAFEKMLTYANHLGLYSEEIGARGELLGNFPQAFTHLALISAAVNLDRMLGGPVARPGAVTLLGSNEPAAAAASSHAAAAGLDRIQEATR
jgi:GH15 family glucan-1,4-alpha-glucosidase